MKSSNIKKIRENHVKKRGIERFDIELTRETQKRLVAQIKEGRAVFLKRESSTKKHYKVKLDEFEFVVVYSTKHKCLLTVFPFKEEKYKP